MSSLATVPHVELDPAPSQTLPKVNRIKRKPPPSVDFSDRYPPPDPANPFAPLSTLRSRSSAAQFPAASQEDLPPSLTLGDRRPSFTIYPSLPVGLASALSEQGGGGDASWQQSSGKSKKNVSKECHYRTRSQSIAALTHVSKPPPALAGSPCAWNHPAAHADSEHSLVKRPVSPPPVRLPTLVHDDSGTDSSSGSGTESDFEPFHYKHPRSASSRSRLADFFLPRKLADSEANPGLRGRQMDPSKRVTKMSISSPMPLDTGNPGKLARPSIVLPALRPITGDSGSTSASSSECGPSETSCSSASPYSAEIAARYRVSLSPLANTLPGSSASSDSEPSPSNSSPTYRLPTSHSAPATSGQKRFLPPHVHASDARALPSAEQIANAGAINVVAESGVRIPFGALFAAQRTTFIFVRHFWCPRCQDYLRELSARFRSTVEAALTQGNGAPSPAANMRIVVIGHGAPAMVSKYRQMLGIPFDVYTDPTRQLFTTLGMREHTEPDTVAPRPPPSSARMSKLPPPRAVSARVALERPGTALEKPSAPVDGSWVNVQRPQSAGAGEGRKGRRDGYVRHSLVGGIATVVYRALKVGMPILENGGDVAQLGGEFIFGPGNVCTYAHRMQNTSDHAPVTEVLMAAMTPGPKFKLLPLALPFSLPLISTEPDEDAAPQQPHPPTHRRNKPTHERTASISQPIMPSLAHPESPKRFPTYAEYAARSASGSLLRLDLDAALPPIPVDLDRCSPVSLEARRSVCLPDTVEEAEEPEPEPESEERAAQRSAGEGTGDARLVSVPVLLADVLPRIEEGPLLDVAVRESFCSDISTASAVRGVAI